MQELLLFLFKKNDEKEGERERERIKSRDRKGELGRERKRSNLQNQQREAEKERRVHAREKNYLIGGVQARIYGDNNGCAREEHGWLGWSMMGVATDTRGGGGLYWFEGNCFTPNKHHFPWKSHLKTISV